MKKTYINPETTIVIVSMHSMICASGSLNPTHGSGNVSETSVEEGTPGESRRGIFWDDED